jgi:hypothetical protein
MHDPGEPHHYCLAHSRDERRGHDREIGDIPPVRDVRAHIPSDGGELDENFDDVDPEDDVVDDVENPVVSGHHAFVGLQPEDRGVDDDDNGYRDVEGGIGDDLLTALNNRRCGLWRWPLRGVGNVRRRQHGKYITNRERRHPTNRRFHHPLTRFAYAECPIIRPRTDSQLWRCSAGAHTYSPAG